MLRNRQTIKPKYIIMGRILYLLDKYPSYTEAFIDNELRSFSNKYNHICVFAIRKELRKGETSTFSCFYPEWWNPMIHLNVLICFFGFTTLLKRYQGTSDVHSNLPGSLFRKYKLFFLFFNIKKVIKKRHIDHIHAHFANYPTDLAMFTSDRLALSFSFSAHAQDIYTQPSTSLATKIEKAKFVITCTKYNKKYLSSICRPDGQQEKIHCIYHGVDWGKWQNKTPKQVIDPKKIKLLSIARLVEKKGIDDLINAVSLLKISGYDISCTIIGEGPMRRKHIQDIKQSGLESAVIIKDFMPHAEIKKQFKKHDIFVLPSVIASNGDRDGLPNVLLESLAMGMPTVSTTISAIPELIQDRETGIIVPTESPQKIAKAIQLLVNSPELVRTLRVNGLEKVKKDFDFQSCNQKLMECFQDELNIYR